MKKYKVHDSMRLAVAAIRDKIQAVLDLDEEFGTLTMDRRAHYQGLLDQAEDAACKAMYQETDGRTLSGISAFINSTSHIADQSVWSLA